MAAPTTTITPPASAALASDQSDQPLHADGLPSVSAIRLHWRRRQHRREPLWLDEFLRTTFMRHAGAEPAAASASGREQMIVSWLSLVEGVAKADAQDVDGSLAMLRHLVRAALESFPADDRTVWVRPVGAGEVDRTATYLVVACLRLRDVDARPWLWGSSPATGRCLHCRLDDDTHGMTTRWLPIIGCDSD